MPAGHQKLGVAALLFDRLMTSEQAGDGLVQAPVREVCDLEDLRASINEQLSWLLNTRVPVDYATLDTRTRAGTRSTIDYGLPDLTVYPIGDSGALVRLCTHLGQTIRLFEPRLLNPRVTIAPTDGRSDALIAEIAGQVRIGMVVAPVTFTFDIDVKEGLRDGG